ncbi:hypothetical protein LXA43DRAFT_138657 [Ganoderma leucocontextum]|nr:hypothetical protein LXA43DRAFT_138657 [Ganoderma leucocontextum]
MHTKPYLFALLMSVCESSAESRVLAQTPQTRGYLSGGCERFLEVSESLFTFCRRKSVLRVGYCSEGKSYVSRTHALSSLCVLWLHASVFASFASSSFETLVIISHSRSLVQHRYPDCRSMLHDCLSPCCSMVALCV